MSLQRPTVRTTPALHDFVASLRRALPGVDQKGFAVLYAQYMCETGGRHCYGFNLGNVRPLAGEPYHALKGVWEGVSAAYAAQLVAAGRATYDTSAAHQKAVAPKTAVVFGDDQPEARFRCYDSLDEGMSAWVTKLRSRFPRCWAGVERGDVVAFANGLKSHGYMTASAEAYIAVMRPHYAAALKAPIALEAVEPSENTIGSVAHGTHVVDWALAQRDADAFGVEVGTYGLMLEEVE